MLIQILNVQVVELLVDVHYVLPVLIVIAVKLAIFQLQLVLVKFVERIVSSAKMRPHVLTADKDFILIP